MKYNVDKINKYSPLCSVTDPLVKSLRVTKAFPEIRLLYQFMITLILISIMIRASINMRGMDIF